jgi:hypothetical protein
VASPYKHSKKPSGSVNDRWTAGRLSPSQEGKCSMELDTNSIIMLGIMLRS